MVKKILSEKTKPFFLGIVAIVTFGLIIGFLIPDTEQKDAEIFVQKVHVYPVEKYKDTKITVPAMGYIESVSQAELRSEISGKIIYIPIRIGDEVSEGDVIAQFDTETLQAQVSQAQYAVQQAQGQLRQVLAGATEEQIRQTRASVSQAEAGLIQANKQLEKARITTKDAIEQAETAVETAKTNLRRDSSSMSDNVIETNQSVIVTSQAAILALQNALTDSDSILGIDNVAANDEFEAALGIRDQKSKYTAQSSYTQIKTKIPNARTQLLATDPTNPTMVRETSDLILETLSEMNIHLEEVSDLIKASAPVQNVTQTKLDSLNGIVTTARNSIQNSISTLTAQQQAANNADTGNQSQEIAYQQALKTLENTKAQAEQDIEAAMAQTEMYEAQKRQAEASLDALLANPRSVDTESLRAGVKQAEAGLQIAISNLDKAFMRAPFGGTIGEIKFKENEFINAGQTVATIANVHALQIKGFVNKKDAAKISVGNSVLVDNVPMGEIIKIGNSLDSETNKIEIISTVSAQPDDMFVGEFITCAIELNAEPETLTIPLSAVKTTSNGSFVISLKEDSALFHAIEIVEIYGEYAKIKGIDTELPEEIVIPARGIDNGQNVSAIKD